MPRTMADGDIFRNPAFALLSYPAQVLYLGLGLHSADQWGRSVWLPAELKADVFRHDDRMKASKVARLMAEVDDVMGDVLVYEVDGKPYFQLTDWEKTCQLRGRKPSKYPEPPETAKKQLKLFEWRQSLVKKGLERYQVQGQSQDQGPLQSQDQGQRAPSAQVTGRVTGLRAQCRLTDKDFDDLVATVAKSPEEAAFKLAGVYARVKSQMPEGVKAEQVLTPLVREFGPLIVAMAIQKTIKHGKKMSDPGPYWRRACENLKVDFPDAMPRP